MPLLLHEDTGAIDRLASLGLNVEDLAFTLRGADAEARTWTPLAPSAMAGMARWGKTNELLRVRLLPRGWSHDNPKGLPRTINPAKDFAIVATAGDAATGIREGTPTTRYAKGMETARAIEQNVQLAFDFADMDIGPALAAAVNADEALATWLLLYNVADEHILAELSLPNGMSDRGFVGSWSERVILPPIELNGADVIERGTLDGRGGEGITVAVEKR